MVPLNACPTAGEIENGSSKIEYMHTLNTCEPPVESVCVAEDRGRSSSLSKTAELSSECAETCVGSSLHAFRSCEQTVESASEYDEHGKLFKLGEIVCDSDPESQASGSQDYHMTIAEVDATAIDDSAFREPPGLEGLGCFDLGPGHESSQLEYVCLGSGSWGGGNSSNGDHGNMHDNTQASLRETAHPSGKANSSSVLPAKGESIGMDDESDDELIMVNPFETTLKSQHAKERDILLKRSKYVHANNLSRKIPVAIGRYSNVPVVTVGISSN